MFRVHILQAIRLGALGALLPALLLCGCASFRRNEATPEPQLDAAEQEFASALAHYAQGLIYENELGWSSPAVLESYRSALDLDPARRRLTMKVAQSAVRQDAHDKAIEALQQACDQAPDDVERWIELATVAQVLGRNATAASAYERAIKLSPAQLPLHLQLVSVRFALDEDKAALKAAKSASRVLEDASPIFALVYSRTKQLIENREVPRAILCLEFLARQMQEQRAALLLLLAELHETEKEPRRALRCLRQAVDIPPPNPGAYISLADFHMRQSDSKRAIQVLEEARKALPQSPAILFALAFHYTHLDETDRALALFEETKALVATLEDKQLPAEFYLQYGATCEQSGDIDRAESVFSEGIGLHPNSAELLNYLAYMWAENDRNLDQALRLVVRALEHAPANGAYLDTMGWIYYKQKNYTLALQAIEAAQAAMPDDPVILDHLGDVYAARHEKDKAVEYWKKSYAIDPQSGSVGEKLESHGVDLDADTYSSGKPQAE